MCIVHYDHNSIFTKVTAFKHDMENISVMTFTKCSIVSMDYFRYLVNFRYMCFLGPQGLNCINHNGMCFIFLVENMS